jgi:enoyl-[acyl-carrier protein] reductase II
VDAIVAEGFEAGGHNGIEETTTMALIPALRSFIDIPIIAAGGIASGQAMLAAMALGADGVQMGSRFVTSLESSAHHDFKIKVLEAKDGDTRLTFKELVPVRLLRNDFLDRVDEAYSEKATKEELIALLGKGRAKQGMFEGDMVEGELEIGQVSASINSILPVAEIINEIVGDYKAALKRMNSLG